MEQQKEKIGIVLEGGAMRGLFSAGIMDVLLEEGISFDGGIGVSAGAAFGCNYKSNQPGRVIRYNCNYSKDPRYAGLRSWVKTGDWYGADFCYHELPTKLDIFDAETFGASPMEFYCVCTDVESGKPVYHKCETGAGEDLDWIRASASMPLASRIVEIGGYKLLDGGISDSIPLQYFEEIGYTKNLVVLTQPRDFVKTKNKYLPLLRLTLRKYPAVLQALANRHTVYNRTLKYIHTAEAQGRTFVIQPDFSLSIHPTERDPGEMRRVYALGRAAAIRRLPELKRFLGLDKPETKNQ